MGRPLAECGTFTAYKRHKRNGEPVDDACAQAARDQANERNAGKRASGAEKVRAALAVLPEPDPEPESEPVTGVDELAEAYETLNWIKALMAAGTQQGAAALAKQRLEVVALIKRLEGAAKPKESMLDELARKRAERLAKAAN